MYSSMHWTQLPSECTIKNKIFRVALRNIYQASLPGYVKLRAIIIHSNQGSCIPQILNHLRVQFLHNPSTAAASQLSHLCYACTYACSAGNKEKRESFPSAELCAAALATLYD